MPATTPILQLPYPVPDDAVDVPRDVQALAEAIEAHGAFIVAEVRWVAVLATPRGWLPCDGAAVSRTTYAKLYAALADRFGAGDGSTTFNVPDFRGRVPVGAGTGPGLTARAIATKWGVEAVLLTGAQSGVNGNGGTGSENASHTHQTPVYLSDSGTGWAYASAAGPAAIYLNAAPTGGQSSNHQHALTNRSADTYHDNTQPSLAVPAYIYAGS